MPKAASEEELGLAAACSQLIQFVNPQSELLSWELLGAVNSLGLCSPNPEPTPGPGSGCGCRGCSLLVWRLLPKVPFGSRSNWLPIKSSSGQLLTSSLPCNLGRLPASRFLKCILKRERFGLGAKMIFCLSLYFFLSLLSFSPASLLAQLGGCGDQEHSVN